MLTPAIPDAVSLQAPDGEEQDFPRFQLPSPKNLSHAPRFPINVPPKNLSAAQTCL